MPTSSLLHVINLGHGLLPQQETHTVQIALDWGRESDFTIAWDLQSALEEPILLFPSLST